MTYRRLQADIGITAKSPLATGSTGGIGHATVRALAAQGCHVMMHGLAGPAEVESNRKGLADELRVAGPHGWERGGDGDLQ